MIKNTFSLLTFLAITTGLVGCANSVHTSSLIKKGYQIDSTKNNLVIISAISEIYQIDIHENKKEMISTGEQISNNLNLFILNFFKKGKFTGKVAVRQLDTATQEAFEWLQKITDEYLRIEIHLLKRLVESRSTDNKNSVSNIVLEKEYTISTSMDPYVSQAADLLLLCKAANNFSSSGRKIKNTLIVAGAAVLAVALVADGDTSGIAYAFDSNKNVIGTDYVSCSLIDIASKQVLWYNAHNVIGSVKNTNDLNKTLIRVLSQFPKI